MAENFNTLETLNGTDGKLWVNETLVGSVQSFVLKQKNIWEDVHKSGNLGKSRRLVGFELSGTISKYKIDNAFTRIMEECKDGNPPDIKLIGLLENKNSGMMQRAVIKGVTLDELDIINFEQKKVLMEEIPYEAEDYYYQDLT